ncbi:hypothetical protein SLS58_006803 [Diplodia intermedia]|uniref:Uncharacterized protein n=1 Tax=Diplodia intermedia TaxID=856260 RepID=A0ABR3TM53_9PEZI
MRHLSDDDGDDFQDETAQTRNDSPSASRPISISSIDSLEEHDLEGGDHGAEDSGVLSWARDGLHELQSWAGFIGLGKLKGLKSSVVPVTKQPTPSTSPGAPVSTHMNSFIPLTMATSNGATADACSCKKATGASDIQAGGHIAQANTSTGDTVHGIHMATQTTGNSGSNHSATQTHGRISDTVFRFHPSASATMEPTASNDHVGSAVMPGLWTKPATVESLAMQLEEEKRKRREAEQMVRELWAKLIENKDSYDASA